MKENIKIFKMLSPLSLIWVFIVMLTLLSFHSQAQMIYRKGTAAGTDTYTVSVTPTFSAYYEDQRFMIEFTNANTGAATLNVNSKGAVSLVKEGGTALGAGDIKAGEIKLIVYDGANMQIIGDGGAIGDFWKTAGTTTLTGNTTINGTTRTLTFNTNNTNINAENEVNITAPGINLTDGDVTLSINAGVLYFTDHLGGISYFNAESWEFFPSAGGDVSFFNNFGGIDLFSPIKTYANFDRAPIVIGPLTAAPVTVENGAMWYNNATNFFQGTVDNTESWFVTLEDRPNASDDGKAVRWSNSSVSWEWYTPGDIVEDNITDGATTTAPSENAVFDALALKANLSGATFTGKVNFTATTSGEAGINVGSSGAPFPKVNGDVWYDTNFNALYTTVNDKNLAVMVTDNLSGSGRIPFASGSDAEYETSASLVWNNNNSILQAANVTVNENGKLILVTIPTDCTGEVSGTVWSDSGTLKVCP